MTFRSLAGAGLFVTLVSSLLGPASASTPQTARTAADAPQQHEFLITNFKSESGVTLPQARIVYGTYGHLNAAGDNAVLLPSHYMANWHGYEWLIGADKALDASKLFLVATELFGNSRSSSPSNTPEPFHGRAFPS
jgi:homoserine O-acetyltransferase